MKRSLVPGSLALTTVVLAFASGCAHMPEPVAVPTGEPLSVHERTETGSYTTKEKVGEVEYKNSSGQKVGTGDVYENRTHTYQYQVWNAYQGGQRISDDDLYRIAKDEEADREVREKRENGVLLNRLGLGGLVLGAVVAGAGYGIGHQMDNPAISNGAMTGGALIALAGGILAYVGLAKTHSEHPLDQSRATRAANQYNTKLGIGTTATTSAYFR